MYKIVFVFSLLSINIFSADFQKYMDVKVNKDLIKSTLIATECIAKIAAIDRSDLRRVVGFESAVTSLVTNMQYLTLSSQALSSMGICAVSPYLGVISAVCSLISMFGDDDESMEALQHALIQISEQIAKFQENVMKRFDGLEDQIDLSHRKIMIAFVELHRDQQRIKQSLSELKDIVKRNQFELIDKLQEMRRENLLRHREIFNQFATIHTDKINEVVSNILFELNCGKIDGSNLANKVHELYNCISITSKNSTLTGSNSLSLEDSLTHSSVENGLSHPAYFNVNLIKQYYASRFNQNFGENVFNPLIFVQCAKVLTYLISTVKPSFDSEEQKNACLSDMNFIIKETQNTLRLLHSLQSEDKVNAIIEDCKNTINKLQALINEYIKQEVDLGLKELEKKVTEDLIAADLATLGSLPVMNFDQLQEDLRAARSTTFISKTNLHRYLIPGYPDNLEARPNAAMSCATSYTFQNPQLMFVRNKPIRSYSWYAQAVQDINSHSSVDRERGQFTHLIAAAKQKHNQAISQAKDQVIKNRNLQQPISLLIYPGGAHPNNKQPLLCTEIKVDPVYVQAERMGLGKIKAVYSCTAKSHFTIDVMFNDIKTHIACYEMAYDCSDCTDEDVINFWYGGIYAKDQDIWKFQGSDDLGPFDQRIKLPIFWEPYPANNTKFSSAQVTVYNQNLNHIKSLIDQNLARRRKLANGQILQQLQLPSNKFSVAAGQLDRFYKVLESILALRVQRSDNTLLRRLSNDSRMVKDRNSLVTRLNAYEGQESFNFAQESVQNFDNLKREFAQLKPDQLMLLLSLAKLEESKTLTSASRINRRISADERIEEVARAQRELRGEFNQLRGDLTNQLSLVRGEFSESFGRLFKLLEAPRQ